LHGMGLEPMNPKESILSAPCLTASLPVLFYEKKLSTFGGHSSILHRSQIFTTAYGR
jgi:hypothetical protein